jgi:hypothetical protein
LGEFLLLGQGELVLAGEHLVVQVSERLVSDGFVFLGIKNETERWVLIGQSPVFPA